jgi:hypothetical protein
MPDNNFVKRKLLFPMLLLTTILPAFGKNSPALADTTILIIRHAEKPATGTGLTPEGEKRAQAYVHYFRDFTVDSKPFALDYIIASADSKNSHRPRLTMEPLSKAAGLSIDNQFGSKQFQELANALLASPHGKHMLICWHHVEIPDLIRALHGNPDQILPEGKWPDQTFNWIVLLRYDANGQLLDSKRIQENLMPGDTNANQ